ncbi:MAG: hypothetical protein ACK2UF_17715, partial [Candidatus Promineifilaceae bacterium]
MEKLPDNRLQSTPKMDMLGVKMDLLSYKEMYPIFDKWLADKSDRSHSLAVINVQCCVNALLDPSLRDVYNSADMVGPDGL